MKAGLNGHAEVCFTCFVLALFLPILSFIQRLKDQAVHVTIADDRERDRPSDRGGFGGRGRGRGGFAHRAVAQAGLFGRGVGSRRNENGENGSKPAEAS